MLSSQMKLDEESLLSHLTFKFPEDIDMDENVVFEAHPCWSKPDANPKYHLIGFKITDDIEKYSKVVDILIKKYGTEGHLSH